MRFLKWLEGVDKTLFFFLLIKNKMVAKKRSSKKSSQKINFETIIHTLIVAIIMLFIINMILTFSVTDGFNKKIDNIIEEQRPADISLTIINAQCSSCQSIQTVVDSIKSANVNIEKETNLNAEEAQDLIIKYNIQKLPAIIITGEINKTNINSMTKVEDVLVYINAGIPYYDIEEKKIKGEVTAVVINPDECKKCYNSGFLISQLQQSGIVIQKIETKKQSEAWDLIIKYNIQKLPAIILSEGLGEYTSLVQAWSQLGVIKDNSYVVTTLPPPYLDLQSGQIKGLVKVTYLTDKTCTTCYDVMNHKQVMQRFGVEIDKDEIVDISSTIGKQLITKYKITKVPIVIFSKDISAYDSFIQVLSTVSEKQTDGSVVFTNPEVMGIYKDIIANKIIIPER